MQHRRQYSTTGPEAGSLSQCLAQGVLPEVKTLMQQQGLLLPGPAAVLVKF